MIILSNISDRIREFMVLRNFTPKSLAEELHVTHATVLNVLSEKHAPSTKLFFALLGLFQCSAEYLLGLVDDYPEQVTYLSPTSDFGARFSFLLKTTGVSQYALTKTHGISGNLIYRWLHNQTLPSPENFAKLAKAFGCSVDFILGRSDF